LALPRVVQKARQGSVLHPLPFFGDDVMGLSLVGTGSQGCGFCTLGAIPGFPPGKDLVLFSDSDKALKAELQKHKPRAVVISPSADPFPPLADVQVRTARLIDALASSEVEAWLLTRGWIRPSVWPILQMHRKHVRLTIAVTAMDRATQRMLEPLTASARLRLRQIHRLRSLGMKVQVALEPLVPGITDQRASLVEVFQGLSQIGIKQVTAGYLCLRSQSRENLATALTPPDLSARVLEAFAEGPWIKTDHFPAARYLPKRFRQRAYAGLMALAAGYGITVRISGLSNPDFQLPRLGTSRLGSAQPLLPIFSTLAQGGRG
jgi:DNA repair photolyase